MSNTILTLIKNIVKLKADYFSRLYVIKLECGEKFRKQNNQLRLNFASGTLSLKRVVVVELGCAACTSRRERIRRQLTSRSP